MVARRKSTNTPITISKNLQGDNFVSTVLDDVAANVDDWFAGDENLNANVVPIRK